jgi:hypothetical protein
LLTLRIPLRTIRCTVPKRTPTHDNTYRQTAHSEKSVVFQAAQEWYE